MNSYIRYSFLLPAVAICLFSCSSTNTATTKETAVSDTIKAAAHTNTISPDQHFGSQDLGNEIDLSKYGMPVLIMAPRDAWTTMDSATHEVYVYANKHFAINISAHKNDKAEALTAQMRKDATDKTKHPDFVKLRDDVPCGYLAEYGNNLLKFEVCLEGKDGTTYKFTNAAACKCLPATPPDYNEEDMKTMYVSGESAELKQ